MTDSKYDQIKNQIIRLESEFPYLKTKASIQDQIGAPVTKRFKKMRNILIKTQGLLEYELDISETDNQKETSSQALKGLGFLLIGCASF